MGVEELIRAIDSTGWGWIVIGMVLAVFTYPVLRAFRRKLTGANEKPSTLRPRDPPKGQRPQGHPGRERVRPLRVDEEFWMPCVQSQVALGRLTEAAEEKLKAEVARGIPRKPVEWTCSYCETVNRDVATCSNCGAPCQVSEKVEAVKKLGRVGGGSPIPPPE